MAKGSFVKTLTFKGTHTMRTCRSLYPQSLHCTYGFDVIATIGWNRQTDYHSFERIHSNLRGRMLISESQTRYLYTYCYLPLLACHERMHWDKLERASQTTGLIMALDGLAPEGGEPQLWIVRELQTGLTLRSGWMSEQKQSAFELLVLPDSVVLAKTATYRIPKSYPRVVDLQNL